MTLVIGLKAKDGIVLASDSRASSVLTSNDTVRKIFQLGDDSAVGISGDGGLATYFLDQVKDNLNYGTGVEDLAEQIRKRGKEIFNDFFEHLSPKDRPGLTLLLVGHTKKIPKKAEIYTLRSEDNFVPRKCVTGFECIGVPYIADYLLNRLYESEIKLESGAELCVLCIQETSSQDRSVGGITKVATLNKTFKELTLTEVEKLKKKTEQFQLTQKSKFYPEEPNQ
jgi:20S proteasome alpha/beta subunit